MSKELGPAREQDYKRLHALLARLSFLSPRDCAVVATSAVDSLLEDLLRAGMRDDVPSQMFQGFGPLASLSAKIEVAYGFGLISAGEKQELHLLRKIRNDFAHSWASSGSFDEAPIGDLVREMRLTYSSLMGRPTSLERDFRTCVEIITGLMVGRLEATTRPTAPLEIVPAVVEAMRRTDPSERKPSDLALQPKPPRQRG